MTAVLIKNLYLSCDPWMRFRMSKHEDGGLPPAFVIGELGKIIFFPTKTCMEHDMEKFLLILIHQALVNFAVGKVVDSTHQEFNAGDLVWGMSAWEEYTLVTQPESLHKINHTELPLSYTGVLATFSGGPPARPVFGRRAPAVLTISPLPPMWSGSGPVFTRYRIGLRVRCRTAARIRSVCPDAPESTITTPSSPCCTVTFAPPPTSMYTCFCTRTISTPSTFTVSGHSLSSARRVGTCCAPTLVTATIEAHTSDV
jgi:hypothetical protein